MALRSKVWSVGDKFSCPRCGKLCGREYSMELIKGGIVRWCDCGCLTIGKKNMFDFLNCQVANLAFLRVNPNLLSKNSLVSRES